MHGDDGLGARRYRRLDLRHIHRVGARINIDEDGLGSGIRDCFCRGHEGHWYRNHLVAITHTEREKGEPERVRAITYSNTEFRFAVFGKVFLELGDKGTAGKRIDVNYLVDGGHYFRAYWVVVSF